MRLRDKPSAYSDMSPSLKPTVITLAPLSKRGSSSSSSSSSPLISLSRSFMLCVVSQLLFLSAHSGSSFMGADGSGDLSVLSRGVPLMKRALYDPNVQTFACLDGSRVIPVRQVNDDYCDCKDGSDEPGTSACPQGSFYCPNLQYKPLVIPSSRVNDGICDCCDGSDEWRGVVLCSNICTELGKVLREEAAKEMEMKRAGWTKRLEYSTNGRKENDDRKLKLEELKQKKESLQKDRDAAAEAKNEIEARETEAKEKHEAAWEIMKSARREELRRLAAENAFKELDTSEDGLLTVAELHGRHDLDSDGDGELSAAEAATLIGEGNDAGVDTTVFIDQVWPKIEAKYRAPAAISIDDKPAETAEDEGASAAAEAPNPEQEAEPAVEVGVDAPPPSVQPIPGEEDENDDVGHREDDIPDDHIAEGIEDAMGGGGDDVDDDDDDEGKDEAHEDDDVDDYDDEDHHHDDHHDEDSKPDASSSDKPSTEFASKVVDEALGLVKPDYDEDAKAKIAAAEEARSAFNAVDDEFRNLEREINDLEKTVGLDLGRAYEFAPLHGKCLEYTDREYVYKLCMYDRASQRPKHGGGETSLGTFTGWENDYLLMKYEHGQGCWNGPNRSAKVVLTCGVVDELTSVSEPSRCEYDFRVTTPAVCDKPDEGAGDDDDSAAAKSGPPDHLGRDEL